ncbi:MAG: hypothetical protein ACI8XB_001736, partial [Patiriisocius sp.]
SPKAISKTLYHLTRDRTTYILNKENLSFRLKK